MEVLHLIFQANHCTSLHHCMKDRILKLTGLIKMVNRWKGQSGLIWFNKRVIESRCIVSARSIDCLNLVKQFFASCTFRWFPFVKDSNWLSTGEESDISLSFLQDEKTAIRSSAPQKELNKIWLFLSKTCLILFFRSNYSIYLTFHCGCDPYPAHSPKSK